MSLALGTVQFSTKYGISNTHGRPTTDEVKKILAYAAESNINVLDTASEYGDAEEILGKNADINAKIITKTPKVKASYISKEDVVAFNTAFLRSLKRLKKDSAYALLFHDSTDLLKNGSDKLYSWISELKRNGLIEKIGVSVYHGIDLHALLRKYDVDLVQLPLNIFDQRYIQDGTLDYLSSKGVEVHARSIFLQGLIFLQASKLPSYFEPISQHLKTFHDKLSANNLTPLDAAIWFIKSQKKVDKYICGVNSVSELSDIVRSNVNSVQIDLSEFAISEPAFLDPTRWVL